MSVLREVGMVTVGGVDTYYDYDEQRWKYRRLGGGPVHAKPAIPLPATPQSATPARADAVGQDAVPSRRVRTSAVRSTRQH